jgi:hypothetical protein
MNTSQILPECLPLKADVFAVSIEQCRFLMIIYLKTPLDLNDINYLCLAPPSTIIHNSRIPPPPGGTAILPEYIHYYG